jgi:LPPG:FO 2-phospho-L-lactate transferase
LRLLHDNAFASVVICPSNPFVSVDPILQVPGLWLALRDSPAPVVLVSPIVAGLAIKGPAAKMMAELGVPVTALGVAQHYCTRYPGLLDYFVIDDSDATLAEEIGELGIDVAVTSTVMKNREDKQRLACFTLQLGVH